VPVFDSQGEVRGGLLVGHSEPGRFTLEDEAILIERRWKVIDIVAVLV
jgi:hypothetical protein